MSILRPDPPPVNRDGLDEFEWPDGRWTTGPAHDDDCDRWTITEIDGPRPSVTHGTEPDPWASSFHAGFTLGADGEDPLTPADLSPYLQRAYLAGVVAGSREYDRRIDAMFADRDESGPRETDGFGPGYYS
jgi:hypothetical protein